MLRENSYNRWLAVNAFTYTESNQLIVFFLKSLSKECNQRIWSWSLMSFKSESHGLKSKPLPTKNAKKQS